MHTNLVPTFPFLFIEIHPCALPLLPNVTTSDSASELNVFSQKVITETLPSEANGWTCPRQALASIFIHF